MTEETQVQQEEQFLEDFLEKLLFLLNLCFFRHSFRSILRACSGRNDGRNTGSARRAVSRGSPPAKGRPSLGAWRARALRSPQALSSGNQPIRASDPGGGTSTRGSVSRDRRPRSRLPSRDFQPEARRQDGHDLQQGLQQPYGPDPGREYRSDPGGQAFRSFSRETIAHVCRLVDQGLYRQVPSGQFADGQNRDNQRPPKDSHEPEPRKARIGSQGDQSHRAAAGPKSRS